MLSLSDATEQVGKSRSTLIRAIKAGKLSASRNEHGDYRIDPAELHRVFPNTARHDEPDGAPSSTPNESPVVADLLKMVKGKDAEIAEMRDELSDTRKRLNEMREAMSALPSPESVALERERLRTEHKAQLERERLEQSKLIATEKQRSEQWVLELKKRKSEIQQAREEAERISQKASEDIAIIERRAAHERAVREALESRGFIARLLNRKPVPVE